ncbi:hypothetical protein J2Z62_000807 [Mycoplasmoides fastidiosum]|uniref:Uncharacterized protein n=1 Tax=Mycoplasmoides fastidiosum TaxID=92758 RepID=A0ABU0M0A3_9BACT|nr:hypothetical protein [Mycoplasmoides fastidiosum]MDQ0514369.1 hypothetical protein [Mycoplasmoides fastidiosum]UUD38032.1 hypothetical protein NPA10_01395 [Mycoplasmoides fastidiosum]
MTSEFKKNFSLQTSQIKWYQATKWLISFGILASTTIGFSVAIYLTKQAHHQYLADAKFDSTQTRVISMAQSNLANPSGGGYLPLILLPIMKLIY